MTRSRTQQIDAIKRQIARIDLVCDGSLLQRTKVCGKPNCRCARDPAQRHGPYYEWNRWDNGRLRHRAVSAEQAQLIARAQDKYQHLLELLAEWARLSGEAILETRE